jgi:glycosyltransferase involved in cell wall biosynthesis
MRVLLVHNFYQQFGGEDAAALAEYELLRRGGIDVRLYSRHNDEIKEYGVGRKLLFPLATIRSARTISDLAVVIEEFRPDVAYLHNLYPLISPSIYGALKRAGVPIVQAIHDFRPFCANGWLYTQGSVCERCLTGGPWNAVTHKCFKDSRALSAIYAAALWTARASGALDHVAAFLCPTAFVKEKLVEAGLEAGRIRVRPNAVDTRAIRASSGLGEYALYMGRLSAEKGVRTLLAAFRELPDVPLVVAGAGPLDAELREFAAIHRMRHVRFVGFQSGADKRTMIERARFLVAPSECYETFGMAIAEGYAAGRPALGANIGGIPNVIRNGETGLLFEPGSAADLASQARLLYCDPAALRRMGRESRRVAEREYDLSVSFDKLLSTFADVAGEAATEPPASLAVEAAS